MDDNSDNDELRAFLPQAFGKPIRVANVKAQIERTKRVETQAPSASPANEDDDDDDESSESEDEEEFPVSHELVLKTHERAVTSLALEPSGARLVSGSIDCRLQLHDFASMTPTTLRAFKSVDPGDTNPSITADSHPINHVEFGPRTGAHFLCISAHPQAKVMNRNGEIIAETTKGDMYLRDMHNTKGHISEISTATWHPSHPELFVTAGTDSTLRIWDVSRLRCQKHVIVHKSRAAGSAGRTKMTTVAWAGSKIGGSGVLAGTGFDGSLAMWSADGPYSRPVADIRDAHQAGTWTGGIDVSSDGRMLVTRGGDDTIKLWDTRKFKAPVITVDHLSTSDHYAPSNIQYSPDSGSIITGSASGQLHILNSGNLKPVLVTTVTPDTPLITVKWHDTLNQIFTGSANAETHVLYSPNISHRGAKDVMSRAPKKRHADDDPNFTTDTTAGVPGENVDGTAPSSASFSARRPTIGLTASGRGRDPRRPQIPARTPFAKSQPDEKHINENIPLSSMRDEDPREALLKYAELAESEPLFTAAWKSTQPKTVFADLSDNEEEEKRPDKKPRW
jgi:WD40 repeat protein